MRPQKDSLNGFYPMGDIVIDKSKLENSDVVPVLIPGIERLVSAAPLPEKALAVKVDPSKVKFALSCSSPPAPA